MRAKGAKRRVLMTLIVSGLAGGWWPLAAAETIGAGDLDLLQQRLEPLGWQVERSADGDLVLHPPKGGASGGGGEAKPNETGAKGLDVLERALRERGWRVTRDAEGSLLLYPEPETDGEKTDGDDVGASASPGNGTVVLGDLGALQGQLRKRGWRVERASDGSLLLFPNGRKKGSEAPSPSGKEEAESLAKSMGQGDVTIDLTDLDQVTAAVERAGWRTERRGDGSLVLYPGDRVDDDEALPTGVVLPVDSVKEASRIARDWVEAQGEGLSVGRIRRINWIYLVSIVTSEPPYRLKNQLAIRTRDGRVIPLY